MMNCMHNTQFTRILELYPKTLFNDSTFNISFNQVQRRIQTIFKNDNIEQENYDELRMLLVIILKNKLDFSLDINMQIFLKAVNEINIEHTLMLCDIIVLFAIIHKSYLGDLHYVIKDIKETADATVQKLKVANALTDLIVESHDKYSEDLIELTISLCTEILLQIEGKQSHSMLIAIIKKLVQFFNYPQFIMKLWNDLKLNTRLDDKESITFDLMCAFSDIYLTLRSPSFECIINECSYWDLVQRGLSSPLALIRKQSIYLLKRIIDTVSVCKDDILFNAPGSVSYWKIIDNEHFKESWLKYFIVMDSLDEKPSHIVMPALQLIDSLRRIQTSWLDIMVRKIMSHDTESVKRFGILYALKNIFLDFNNDKRRSETMLLLILNSLNDTKIYPEENDERANIVLDLKQFLQNIQGNIIEYILKINWAPVPLFYISYSLFNSENKSDVQNADMVLKLIQTCTNSPNVYIRSAMQINILKYYMRNITLSLNVSDLPVVLAQFSSQESLRRGTKTWFSIINWMQSLTLDKQNILCMLDEDHSPTKYNSRQLSRFLILCIDANVITHGEAKILITKMFSYFKSCGNRPYTCNTTQCHILDMANMILTESKLLIIDDKDHTRIFIVRIIADYANAMMDYIKMKLILFNTYNDTDIIDKCLALIKNLSEENVLRQITIKNVHLIMDLCIDNLIKENSNAQKYFSIALLSFFIQYYCDDDPKYLNYLKNSYELIAKIKDIFNLRTRNNKELSAVSSRVASSFHKYFCGILCEFVKCEGLTHEITDILKYIEDVLEYGGNDIVLDVLCVLKSLIPNLKVDETLKHIIYRCWNESLNLRKSDLFLPCIQSFINMLIQPDTLSNNNLVGVIEEYCHKIIELGRGIQGLLNILYKKIFELCHYNYDFTDIIIEGLLFGNISRRDQRIEDYTCRFIEILGDVELVNNEVETNLEVRALAIASLLKILHIGIVDMETKSLHETAKNMLDKVTSFLMQKCIAEDKNKTRHFSDSKHHRFKQRVLQTLIVMQPFWDCKQYLQILFWANESLMKDIHQPSVRYLLEWLVARIVLQDMKLMDHLWESMEKVPNVRIGAMSSFICVIYLIAQQLTKYPKGIRDNFIKKSVSKVIPWTMGQHFNLRLYAQVVTRKLLLSCREDIELNTLEESLSAILSYGNAVKFVKKVEDDVFLSDFDIIEHFSLENIFYTLPKLTKYTREDVIPVKVFESLCNINKFTDTITVPLLNQGPNIENAEISAWGINLHNLEDTKELGTENELNNYNVQQKTTPWRAMDVPGITTDAIVEENSKAGLIVVASLVDLAPNLGGLARTCEVFRVKEFVIDNLQRVKDKQFQSLSMTAEKWLRISEVKPWQLQEYLAVKQSEGYCIVGAEQTAKSHCITKVALPEKCLLLLGNEKEGIPANYLPLLDMCIEIPQKGLIRSLNVHVTGALFVWEYAKQYLVN